MQMPSSPEVPVKPSESGENYELASLLGHILKPRSDDKLRQETETFDQSDVIHVPVHPRALELAHQHILKFAADLLVQAKLLAYREGDEVVSRSHIDGALESIKRERETSWRRNFLLALGSAFFGAGVQGFITELSASNRPLWTAVYIVAAFVGLVLVFVGLRRG
jgi:hypothetical protein